MPVGTAECATAVEEDLDAAVHRGTPLADDGLLYAPCRLGVHSLMAMVDTGSESSVMSERMAQRCDLMARCDRRWSGTAVGLGSLRVLGRVHDVRVSLGGHDVRVHVSVIEDAGRGVDFILGRATLCAAHGRIDVAAQTLTLGEDGACLVPLQLAVEETTTEEETETTETTEEEDETASRPTRPRG